MDSLFIMFVFVLTWTPTIMTRGVDWDDVVLARPGSTVTLPCLHTSVGERPLTVRWSVLPLRGVETMLLSANQNTKFQHFPKVGLRLANQNYQTTGDLSLQLVATETDVGRYRCLVEQGSEQVKMAVVLLALVNISVVPANPVPEDSTVRLSARVTPPYAVSMATWWSPARVALLSERVAAEGGQVTKVPRFNRSHQGRYTYTVRPLGNRLRTAFQFGVTVTADMSKVAVFPDPIYDPVQSLVCRSRATVVLLCPPVLGDYVLLYWKQADAPGMKLAYEHDRWCQSSTNHTRLRLHLLSPGPLATEGNFSFLLTPEQRDGGEYRCEVFLDNQPYVQSTQLSVVHVFAKKSATELVLWCLFSERSQVQNVMWTHENRRQNPLKMQSSSPGRFSTTIQLPVAPETAGNYTCAIQLQSGVKAEAVYSVTLPPRGWTTASYTTTQCPEAETTTVHSVTALPTTESSSGSVHSLLPSLSALLLLVPVTTMVTGLFLWRRARSISRRGVEHSSRCGDVENIYENPEDVRQTPQGAVYMALKPTGEDSVYKELDRYDKCK